MPTLGENRVLGSVSPDFRLGFNTTFEFYKFRLSAVLDWKQGGCMYAGTVSTLDYYGVTRNQQTIVKLITSNFNKPACKTVGRWFLRT